MSDRSSQLRFQLLRLDPRGDDELDVDLADEFAFHLDQRRRDLERGGLEHDEARTAAEVRFGDVKRIKIQCRAIAREELHMLQKVNLVLMIVVLLAVIGVSLQMYVTQRYNTLAIQGLSLQMAQQISQQRAGARTVESLGSVYLRGDSPRPGVYSIPEQGLSVARLLIAAGLINSHVEVSIERGDLEGAAQFRGVEVLDDGTVVGEDVALSPNDIVTVTRIVPPVAEGAETVTSLHGLWREVDTEGEIVEDGMMLAILGTHDIRNLSQETSGQLLVIGLAHRFGLDFNGAARGPKSWRRGGELRVDGDFISAGYHQSGRWMLEGDRLQLNLAPLRDAPEGADRIRFTRTAKKVESSDLQRHAEFEADREAARQAAREEDS